MALATATIEEPHLGTKVELQARLNYPRAWHSASVLPDGSVLVVGGMGPEEQFVTEVELFDPESDSFSILAGTGLGIRAHHSATLLTDGHLLLAGGMSLQESTTGQIELYDFASKTAIKLSNLPQIDRQGHDAQLLPDGRVLLRGGSDRFGQPLDYADVFDPERGDLTKEPRPRPESSGEAVRFLEASLPKDHATDITTDAIVSLRFSTPMQAATLSAGMVTLEGPDGQVPVKIVAAEEGRLAFVWPLAPLRESTWYSVRIKAPVALSGGVLQDEQFAFRTGASEADDEEWVPGNGDWRSHRPDSPWRLLPALQAPPGVTALAGQVLTLNGQPLTGVTLKIGAVGTLTDRTGRFLIAPVTAGHHELLIDGRSANKPTKAYGIFEAGVNITQGGTNVLPYTIWMPKIDVRHAVPVPVPTTTEVVVTTPLIPGLELHIPPDTVIYDIAGNPVTQVSITPIPVDRTPFPLPDGVEVPIYFTVQPGGAYVWNWSYTGAKGAWLVYPNYRNEPAGKRVNFWQYDPEDKGWFVYGHGTVTPGAQQVVPDPGVVLYEFTGAMISSGGNPPPWWPAFWDRLTDGDPVDLGSGLFVMQKTDLFLPDTIPIALTRTYRQGDSASRPFGVGSTHPYEMFLWSVNNYQEADLVMPDGARVHYVRITPGNGLSDAIYEHNATPSPFYKSIITWNGNGWDLRLKNGLVYVFGDTTPLQSIHDRFGNAVSITRASGQLGNITKLTSTSGRWVDFTYDGSNRITQAKDNIGRIVSYTYDGSGRLSTVTDAKGGVTTYTYDGSHRMLTIRDPRNIVYLTNEYDSNSRVMRQTLVDGAVFNFSYTVDVNGRVTQTDVTDPRGYVRRVTFNASGYGLTESLAYGTPQQQNIVYTRQAGSHLLESVLDPLGRTTSMTYDSMGNVIGVTRLAGTPSAVTTTLTYNSVFNEVTSITDPLNHATAFSYDVAGNLTSITDALNNQITLTYNAAGQPLTLRDPLLNTYQFSYDMGDLVGTTNPLGKSSTVTRDAAGRIVSSKDPTGRVTTYQYDALDLLTRITDPVGGQTSFTYDGNGNLLTVMDARSNVTTYTYDSMDRPATRTDPLTLAESYAYDLNGNLTAFTDRRGKLTSYTYDPLNRPTLVGFGTVVNGGQTTYESTITAVWDGADRPSSLVDSNSGTITPSFDGRDNLTSEVTPNGTVTYGYDAADRRTSMTVLGQPLVSYAYDNADRLTSITQGSSTVSIAYDAASRRTSLTLPNGVVGTYSYDTASRLTAISYSLGQTTLGSLGYVYDAAERRTKVNGSFARTGLPQSVAAASYNAANQVTAWGGATLTYDANGNLTGDGAKTYTWNARNELVSITGGVVASFQYEGLGRRSSKTVAGVTTGFLYDGFNPVQELSAGTPTANLMTGLWMDEFFTRSDTLGTRTFLKDALGSTIALADSAGALQTQYTYEPYGKTTSTGQLNASSFQFTGRENDGTELFYYRTRYYSASLGRFVSEDPIEFEGGQANLYSYVGNSPVSFRDPLGLMSLSDLAQGHDNLCGMANSVQGRKGRLAAGALVGCGAGGIGMGLASGMAFGGPASEGGFGTLSSAGKYGVQPYKQLRKALKGTGLQAHHLREVRFAKVMGEDAREMLAVALTPAEHQRFTNMWRGAIRYGEGTALATQQTVNQVAREIYANYQAFLKALGL